MCGIVGFMTKETKKLETDRSKFMRQGLIIDTLRGDDSTGVFGVGHEPMFDDGTAFWLKQLGGGADFVDSEGYWTHYYDTTEYRALVGHNRAATVGGVDTNGAHPFQVGPITLVHNGTLRNTYQMPTPMQECMVPTGKEGIERKVSVDSHAVAYNLAHHDVDEVIARLEGAFTLIWHDARDDSMNIIRNTERPLHMALSSQQDTMYFMSEAGMLHLLDQRLKLGLGSIYYPKAGQWLKWLPDTDLDSPEVKNMELYTRPVHNGYYDWYNSDDDDDWRNDGRYSSAMSCDSGKVTAPLTNRVHVGGRIKEVPMPLQETMLSYDLMIEDRLPFVPATTVTSGPRTSVIGRVDEKYAAIVHNMTPAAQLMEKRWTVRPVGVALTSSAEPLVVCRLVSTSYSALVSTNEVKQHDEMKHIAGIPYIKKAGTRVFVPFKEGNCQHDDSGRAMLGYDTSYAGPNGTSLTADEFTAATMDGCMTCHRLVGLADARDIAWSLDGEEFLCWDCDKIDDDLADYYSGRVH